MDRKRKYIKYYDSEVDYDGDGDGDDDDNGEPATPSETCEEGKKKKLLVISSIAHRSTDTKLTNASSCLRNATSVKRTVMNVSCLEKPIAAVLRVITVRAKEKICGKLTIKRGMLYTIVGLPGKVFQAHADALPRSECVKVLDETMGKSNLTDYVWTSTIKNTFRVRWTSNLRNVVADALARLDWVVSVKEYECTMVGKARLHPVESGKFKSDIKDDVVRCFSIKLHEKSIWFDEELFVNKAELPPTPMAEDKLDRVPMRKQLSQLGYEIKSKNNRIDEICSNSKQPSGTSEVFKGTKSLVQSYLSDEKAGHTSLLVRNRSMSSLVCDEPIELIKESVPLKKKIGRPKRCVGNKTAPPTLNNDIDKEKEKENVNDVIVENNNQNINVDNNNQNTNVDNNDDDIKTYYSKDSGISRSETILAPSQSAHTDECQQPVCDYADHQLDADNSGFDNPYLKCCLPSDSDGSDYFGDENCDLFDSEEFHEFCSAYPGSELFCDAFGPTENSTPAVCSPTSSCNPAYYDQQDGRPVVKDKCANGSGESAQSDNPAIDIDSLLEENDLQCIHSLDPFNFL